MVDIYSKKMSIGKPTKLVGGWTNPFEKYARQIGSFPQVIRGEHKKSFKPFPRKRPHPIRLTF